MAGTPLPSTLLSQAAGQEVHSSDKNTMRKNDGAVAPAQPPAEAAGAALAPFTSVMALGLMDPWEKGCCSQGPCRVPGTARCSAEKLCRDPGCVGKKGDT